MLRIAIARISQETNALCPVRAELQDFQRHHLLVGAEILAACGPGGQEVPGYIRRAELAGAMHEAARHGGVEIVPIVSAWTLPGGPLSHQTFSALRRLLVDGLAAAGPLDGMVFVLHGALVADGVEDPETLLMADARAALGADGALAVCLDLHAHITKAKVKAADLLVAFRTNPHRDHFRTGAEGMQLLLRMLAGRLRPVTAWRALPMILGGGTTMDFGLAMLPLHRALARARRMPGVVTANLFLCHPWSVAPDLGWATHVVTDGDPALAERVAEMLADAAWQVRGAMPPRTRSAEEAIGTVRRRWWLRKLGCACLVDTSDVVGAGSTGDHTGLLRALLAHGEGLRSYLPIRDPAAVAALWRQADGERVDLDVGGYLTGEYAPPLRVTGTLRARRETEAFGRIVLLELGHVALAITEGPPFAIRPAFWSALGLSVWRADIVVVKSLFLWLPWFLPVLRQGYLVQTYGPTDFDALTRRPFDGPVHPKDIVDDWRDADRRRRCA
ncbi:MAG: M81 family metallopeptidase [Pseudomonadota bacterium]|nr:M81 family metallopeptidase [Pseudomonadota bacterium]